MPIFPPPPGLLTTELVVSTRRFEVHIACIVLATTSTPAPGAKGTISSTCFDGFQPCACAGSAAAIAIRTISRVRTAHDTGLMVRRAYPMIAGSPGLWIEGIDSSL